MDRNSLVVFISFFLSAAASLIGIVNIGLYSSQSKFGPGSGPSLFQSPQISAALVRIEGQIHSGRSTYSSTGSETILAKLREIGKSPQIKGILVEINSPGGTVAASQEIYNELMHLRKTKKIVVSMKDVAASGGYYIASAADVIFAENGTLTGSIGVISLAPNIKGLLDRYGVEVRVFKAGKYKDSLSPFRSSTEEENQLMNKLLKDTYTQFIEDIAKGRNKTVASIEELAEGKIYSGQDAFRNKLVDDIGGRREAMARLSELVQYEGEIPLIEEKESPFDLFLQSLGARISGKSEFGLRLGDRSPVLLILPSAISGLGLPEGL
jgi:protease-4